MTWRGVMPAVTTPFAEDGAVDLASLARHVAAMVDHGCTAIVALGSLGEGAALDLGEKRAVLETCVASVGDRVPVVAGVSGLSTAEAVTFAREAARAGCRGLMVLPPYVHQGPWVETRVHVSRVIEATVLPCMLYNNPTAYGTDFRPEQVAELAETHGNLQALKESSGDARRVTAVRAEIGDRLAVAVGLDDMVVEGMAVGAVGWVAGLANALPRESVELYELCRRQEWGLAHELYRWFLPLLRLDTVPAFVQLVKLVQQEVGLGSERVRLPRLPLAGRDREEALALIRRQLASRPQV